MEVHQWLTLGLGAAGFIGTWLIFAFKLGGAVEQMRSALKDEIEQEKNKIVDRIETIERRFETDQKTQDHNFGEVGAAMRQYIADVEKKVREVEIYGRDNYVKIPDFERALDRLSTQINLMQTEIKKDLRDLKAEVTKQ